jgi:uncharacterized iron-regulated protein
MRKRLALAAVSVMVNLFSATAVPVEAAQASGKACVPVGTWMVPGGARVDGKEVIARAAQRSIVLLGEVHDSAEHHRWQLQTLAGLHALRPDMVIGFEMFPRRVQEALDRWVSGELSEADFLKAADWNTVWRFDPGLYMPLFHFARMNRIPMVALNISDPLRNAVRKKGFDGVPQAEREGLERPAAASGAYLDRLLEVFREHNAGGKKRADAGRDDADFRRFVEMQELWDGAMAQALRAAQARPGRPLVVGVMGRGHVAHGDGVPYQLKALGVGDVATLLPWGQDNDCKELVAGLADVVFGVAAPAPAESRRQLLGIRIELKDAAVHVVEVQKGSVAAAADLRTGDVITEIAGQPVKRNTDVIAAVQRQAPGTWLPLRIKRNDEPMEIIAKFPPLEP